MKPEKLHKLEGHVEEVREHVNSVGEELQQLKASYTEEAYAKANTIISEIHIRLDRLDTILFAEAASTDEPDTPPEVTF